MTQGPSSDAEGAVLRAGAGAHHRALRSEAPDVVVGDKLRDGPGPGGQGPGGGARGDGGQGPGGRGHASPGPARAVACKEAGVREIGRG